MCSKLESTIEITFDNHQSIFTKEELDARYEDLREERLFHDNSRMPNPYFTSAKRSTFIEKPFY